MTDIVCFKHKKRDCECFRPKHEYQPSKMLMDRKNALEVYYASQCFPENIQYSPIAMRAMAQCYVTIGDALRKFHDFIQHPDPNKAMDIVKMEEVLRKAGF